MGIIANQSGNIRNLGTYVAGNPGSGKSSLLQQMALRDIRMGRGVCFIDPTADSVNRLLHWIPKSRVKDTIYFDTDHTLPIDFFSYHREGERRVLTDELVSVFNLEAAPVSKPRLRRIINTLLDANDNGAQFTLLDIQPFIESKTFREKVTDYCPQRKSQWKEMPPLKEFVPILERLSPFTEPGPLRAIFSRAEKKLDISDVMRENKILLVNLNDTETDLFLGSLIAAKIQQATFARRYIKETERTPYYLYIDECHTIIGYAVQHFEKILTRARKYKLCLVLANQIPSDLPAEIQRKLGTIGTLTLMNLDYKDALIFKYAIRPYEVEDLLNLPPFHAICRINRRVGRINTWKYLGFSPASYAEIIRNRTIHMYACDNPPTWSTTEFDDNHSSKPEDISAGRTPRIPPHGNKKNNT